MFKYLAEYFHGYHHKFSVNEQLRTFKSLDIPKNIKEFQIYRIKIILLSSGSSKYSLLCIELFMLDITRACISVF